MIGKANERLSTWWPTGWMSPTRAFWTGAPLEKRNQTGKLGLHSCRLAAVPRIVLSRGPFRKHHGHGLLPDKLSHHHFSPEVQKEGKWKLSYTVYTNPGPALKSAMALGSHLITRSYSFLVNRGHLTAPACPHLCVCVSITSILLRLSGLQVPRG